MKNLKEEFNKFVGRELNVTENPFEGWGHKFDRPSLDANNPVIDELRAALAQCGITRVRMILPESMQTMDFDSNRLNVHVAKEEDGKYRIQHGHKFG